METTLFRAVLLSVIRHGLTAAGCAVVLEHNAADVEALSGLLVGLAPVVWSAWRSKQILKEKTP
jgi:hypothetical protein